MARREKLAINRLRESKVLDQQALERFVEKHEFPILEGTQATFVAWQQADQVFLRHRVVGIPDQLPLRRIEGTDLWYVVVEIPRDSRVEYQLEVRRGDHWERFNDPLNPKIARSPVGDSSVCYGLGYQVPDWALHDPDARPGELVELVIRSQAQRRDNRVTLYLPARFRTTTRYPLLVVHDGGDFLEYASMKTVLDNLIHRLDMAETVVAFTYPGDRLREYPNSGPHARWITKELARSAGGAVPADRPPLRPGPDGVQLRRDRVTDHGGPLSADVRVAAAAVGLVRVHRHRSPAR